MVRLLMAPSKRILVELRKGICNWLLDAQRLRASGHTGRRLALDIWVALIVFLFGEYRHASRSPMFRFWRATIVDSTGVSAAEPQTIIR